MTGATGIGLAYSLVYWPVLDKHIDTRDHAASAQVARVYSLLGVPERFDLDIFEGGHRFGGDKSFDWFAKWL